MHVLSRFCGATRIYFLQVNHNPPYIHAIYNNGVAAINFTTREVLEGTLPPKTLAMMQELLGLYKDELQEI
ncbi:DUF4160 domain-containing protein [Clostridium sp. MCC334]|nr:DUF4160 domain-containing protein [Clostridium sp. MCC334]